MKRPEINTIPVERAGRLTLGGTAAIVGLILLVSATGALAVVLLALLGLAGFALVHQQLRDTIEDGHSTPRADNEPPRAIGAPG